MRGVAIDGPYSLIDIKLGRCAVLGLRLIAPVIPSTSNPRTMGHFMPFDQSTITSAYRFKQ